MRKVLFLLIAVIGLAEMLNGQTITANFSSSCTCPNNPNVFTDLSTSNPYSISTWFWKFGDGNTSTQQNPTHVYSGYGTFTVTLTVTDSNGNKDSVQHPVCVYPLPVPNFVSDTVCSGDSTCFTNLSFVPSGTITGCAWNFGDVSGINVSNLQNPCYIYQGGSGNYNAALTVTSDSGCQSSTILPVIVNSCNGIQLFFKKVSIIISPNPFSTLTTLQTSISLDNATLILFNSFGEQVKQLENISGNEIILQIENLPSGLYFIQLKEKDKV